MAIGSGYNFRFWYCYDETPDILFLGVDEDGSYGWHLHDMDATIYTNTSFVVHTKFLSSAGDFDSITQNALYTLDGSPINNHTALANARNKLCYLVKDCDISYTD